MLDRPNRFHVAALVVATVLASCRPQPAADNADNVAANTMLPKIPAVEAPQNRQDILLHVMRAASAAAAGIDDRETQRSLDGKLFELHIRFGCRGAAAEGEDRPLSWRFDEESQTLRLRAAPTIAETEPLVMALANGAEFEAIEGFWIPRPWLLSANCPVRPPETAEPAPMDVADAVSEPESADQKSEAAGSPLPVAPPRVGIAQFFGEADSRVGRRSGRAYETVVHLEEGQTPQPRGFDLVLSGRLRALPNGRVIACSGATIDRPPDCLISADIDEVRMERPGERQPLARWEN